MTEFHRPVFLLGLPRIEIECCCGAPGSRGDDEFVAHIRSLSEFDAAWAAAVAALPEGWDMASLSLDRRDGSWMAVAQAPAEPWDGSSFDPFVRATGPTPAAALLALAAHLPEATR